jgi:hypothetical protein
LGKNTTLIVGITAARFAAAGKFAAGSGRMFERATGAGRGRNA